MKNELTPRGWVRKFRLAIGGALWAMKTEGSFRVHLPAAVFVFLAAVYLNFDAERLALLVLTVGTVFTAELLNTALESLAKAVDEKPNEHIRIALDIGSGAVLTTSLFAMAVGAILFWQPLSNWLSNS